MSVRWFGKLVCVIGAVLLGAVLMLPGQGRADQPYSQQQRAQLQQQLQVIEQQIAQYQQELATTVAQKNTLTNKINQLKKQQAALQLQIRATVLQVDIVTSELNDTVQAISQQEYKIGQLQGQMSKFLLLVQQQDDVPLWYRVASSATLSDLFSDLQDYSVVLGGLQDLHQQVTRAKIQLEGQQQTLSQKQDAAQNLLTIKTLQQQKLTETVTTQNTLLQQTKGRESAYQSQIKESKAQAAQIRGRIYQLLDVSTQITFGQAYQIATWVSQATGVRPAFLLAVLTQESNLGKNVGTCNRLGDPPSKQWQAIMKPDRDQQPFLQITRELGMDPNVTPVSCPMRDKNGQRLGWGGAMGPAQFLPSTWLGYRNQVSQFTGKSPANPWDIRDAFAAAAIKLRDGGATSGRQGEWNAALRYFSGSTNSAYSFYAANVQSLADGYQSDIDQLNK